MIRALDQFIEWRGKGSVIRCDIGPEYFSQSVTDWAASRRLRLEFIQPGQRHQNTFVESYHRTVRYDWLAY